MAANPIEGINPLGQRERDNAYHATRARIAGPEPQPDDFARKVFSKYPPQFMRRMRWLGYALLVPAFTPSAIRIFIAAFNVNAEYLSPSGTQHMWGVGAAVIIGLMSVLLAESGQVAFTLWAATLPEKEDGKPDEAQGMRRALRVGAWGCMLFALTANIFIVQPGTQWPYPVACALAWLETVLPPTLVLITSNVLKNLSLHDIENRHAAQQAYEGEHAAWMARVANAHLDGRWTPTLANELRDALRRVNQRSYAKLRALSNDDWRVLVLREMAADDWYVLSLPQPAVVTQPETQADEVPAGDAEPQPPRVRAPRARVVGTSNSNGRHTGEFANAVSANADGSFIGICPHCGWSTDPKANTRSATAALIAHKRSCTALRAPNENAAVIETAESIISEVDDARR